jgi:DNA-binding LacI/PurR family transcriptional regulator
VARQPREKALSIYDIARDLGISSGTVSRAFNDHPEVSQATRERILAKARELGYTPSPLARGLARNVTAAIGIVIPTVYDPFFLEFAQGVQQAAAEAGVAVMMSFTDHAEASLYSAMRSFEQFRVAGVLLLGGSGQHDVGLRQQFPRLPVVVALRRSQHATFPAVFIDHKLGAMEMVRFLHSRGHGVIGYVGLPLVTQAAFERLAGYREAVSALGGGKGRELVAEGNAFADGIAATHRLLAEGELDAIFYASDALATGGLHALAHRGLRVPGDIAVGGFGDIISSPVTVPALTTVHVPMREIGARSVALLLQLLAGGENAMADVQLETTLVVRESA